MFEKSNDKITKLSDNLNTVNETLAGVSKNHTSFIEQVQKLTDKVNSTANKCDENSNSILSLKSKIEATINLTINHQADSLPSSQLLVSGIPDAVASELSPSQIVKQIFEKLEVSNLGNDILLTSKRQRTNVEQFSKRLDKLFDIANCAALKNLPKNLQQFLTDCRKGNRNIHLPAIDVIPEETSGNLSAMEVETPNNEEIGMKLSQQSSLNSFCSSISNSSELKRTCSDFEDTMPAPKKNKIDILTSELVLALDRTKTSNRNAMYIISAVIQSLRLEIDKYNLSYSTIHNARISKREEIVDTIKEKEIFDDSLVVHWDGKMLPAGNGQQCESQASAIFETLIQWDLCDNVKAMCFDTTSSNTGYFNGACALLEDKIGRDLLYLACRHHTSELMLRNVAEVAWPVTNSPNVPIFKRLRDNWEKIDKSAYEIGTEDKDIALILNQRKDDILDFIENQLKNHHPRNDYKEFLELSCIFLGGIKSHRAEFKAPGAFHHARWLSKALYCLKIYMFRNQFKIGANEKKILQKICVFIVIFYVKIWFTAPNAINAPNSD
ncbi:uncharacterized protein LOC123258973 [Cotesia glomerata]|uniref:uncharacterized protein LOC123258973 n=1 Tax=Cotesia glomerata TaxID=32391 RepID=UPI001D00775C|nr:uncharacterized protein LOC123258973 [Cotesia glomerata]